MAQTNVQAFSGDVEISSNLDVHGTAHLSNIASTDYSKQFSQTYDLDFDDITATDEELSLFQFEPGIDDHTIIQGEVDVDILSRRAQTFMQFQTQKVKIKFSFSWDARPATGSWLLRDIFIDRTKPGTVGSQFLNYPVEVRYKYKGDRSTDPDIPPKVQVYLRYNGSNFVARINVKGMYHSNYTDYGLSFPSSIFTTDGDTTDASVDTVTTYDINTGNVGIGTDDPGKKLTVAGNMELGTSNADYQHFRLGGGNSSGFLYGAYAKYADGIHMGYNFYNDNSSNQIPNAGGATSRISMQFGQIQLHTGGVNTEPNNNALCITSNGNVGIGKNDPGTALDIYEESSGADVYALKIQTDNTATASAGALGPGIGFYQRWWTNPSLSIPMAAIHCIKNQANGTTGGGLAFRVGHETGASMQTSMVIADGGNVGIGNTNPGSKLHLLGVGTGSGPRLRFETLNNGNDNYTVSGTEIGGIQFGADDYGWSTQHMSSEIVGIHDTPNYSGARGILAFKTSSTQGANPSEKMRIEHDGNVGIGGITGPTAKLEVYNSATAADAAGLVADFNGPWIRIGDARNARTFSSGTGLKFGDSGVMNFSIGIKDGVFKLGQSSSNGSVLFPGGSTDREDSLCITSDQLLGLGLTNPSTRIHMYKSDFTIPARGTEFGTDTSQGFAFKSRIHTGGQVPAPYWYNSLAIDNFKMWFNPKSYQFVGNNQAGSHGVLNIGGGYLNDTQANTPILTVTTNAKVGINREQPSYTLDIDGTIRYTGTHGSNSDRRIKRNIVDVNDASALETIRLIKPKRYDYIDTKSKDTEDTVWGFIAQEVREVLPYATDVITDFIPNIMTWANVIGSNVITINTTELLSNTTGRVLLRDVFNKNHIVTITEDIDADSLRVEEDLSTFTGSRDTSGDGITEIQTITVTVEEYNALEDAAGYEPVIESYTQTTTTESITVEEYNALEDTTGYEAVISNYTKTHITTPGSEIFVYGQEVDDFHVLKKDAIWTVATAALQEVDRQQRSDKIRITELETQITSVLSRLDALES
jgi:hypothetical protein